MSEPTSAATIYRLRNLVSGLLVPSSQSVEAVPLSFDTYDAANRWLAHTDVRAADFEIEEVEDDGKR